ncbi:MAG TPA: septal ring lytic transglycosylase RlpA family protein [Steroidobacteraceae bacterium]|jgi:rare lipoprotein A|nr:septal ring lytic transglycosylase RlpA family protein [Steroidobacteraceae bacterium]
MRHAKAALLLVFLAGCSTAPIVPPPTPALPPPGDLATIPEPIPKVEPRSKKGNPPFYTVLGKRYFVMDKAEGYFERGVASWYGPGFHAAATSNGERYDMYAMTAAHKTLPLPAYVQVTNLRNGRSVVVRVNDRGPFKDGRIIDLSYTAASRLGMLKDGTTFVEVRALTPEQKAAPPTPPPAAEALYLQAGAFATEANASGLREQLRAQGVEKTFIREDRVDGRTLYRVRVGPLPSVVEFDRVLARLRSLGLSDAQLAAD